MPPPIVTAAGSSGSRVGVRVVEAIGLPDMLEIPAGKLDVEGENPLGAEAEVDPGEADEAPHQQAGAEQQRQREGDLRGDEDVAAAAAGDGFTRSHGRLGEQGGERKARDLQERQQVDRLLLIAYLGMDLLHRCQLILGLAFNEHQQSTIMRREYGDLDRLVEDALKIHGSRDGFNGSPPPKLRITEKQVINFAAA